MERNYDEIISEMLRQIDMHSEQLTRQSEKLEKQYEKSEEFWREQHQINADHLSHLQVLKQNDAEHLSQLQVLKQNDAEYISQLQALKQSDKEQDDVINQNLELALHTAAILDRIIKRNELKV